MSASESTMPGGQPSTTQPIAGPWLSPKVVTRKSCPKVLNDMVFYRWALVARVPAGVKFNSPSARTTVALRPQGGLRVAGQPLPFEHIDDPMLDGIVRSIIRRGDREMRDEGACGAAMGGNHGIVADGPVPALNAQRQLGIAFAPGRQK